MRFVYNFKVYVKKYIGKILLLEGNTWSINPYLRANQTSN